MVNMRMPDNYVPCSPDERTDFRTEYPCGCWVHRYVNDTPAHLHYCRVHAAAPVLRDALRAAERALSAAAIAGKSLYTAEVTQAARAALALADMGKE